MRSAARKDDPFISEFDMGITDHLLESMNKLEMVTTEDYELQKARITHENRPPSDLLLSELKHRVRQYGVWHKGMSREEMEFKLAYQDRRSTKLTRLREASDVAGFGFGNSRLTKIVGDTEKNKNVQFEFTPFVLPRPVFLRLTELENAWRTNSIPDLVLDCCLVAVDAERKWVFGVDAKNGLPKYKFDTEFLEQLKSMEETNRVFWFRPNKSYIELNAFITKQVDLKTGHRYSKLQREVYWWKGKHGDEENPIRFTKSAQKVYTNFKSSSYEPHAVAELIYQSNRNLEPMVIWDPHARRKYVYNQDRLLMTQRLKEKYKSKKPLEIQRMVSKKVKMDDYFIHSYDRLRGIPVAKLKKHIVQKVDDDDL